MPKFIVRAPFGLPGQPRASRSGKARMMAERDESRNPGNGMALFSS